MTSALDRADEARAISRTNGRARRIGDTLRLQLRRGGTTDFVDCTLSWNRYVRYVLRGSGPGQQGFVVFLSQGESWNYFWFDDSHDTAYVLGGMPHFAADSSFFVSANSDLDAEYTANALEVWQLDRTAVSRAFGLRGGPTGFSVDTIVGDSLVLLRMLRMRPDLSTDSLPAYLARRSAGWSLHLGRP